MISTIRSKFGPLIVGLIIAFIAVVFIFTGILPSTSQVTDAQFAGEVNGEPITLTEFNRELARRVEFFKGMFGGEIKEEQLKAFRVREGVFQEIVNRKLMVQQAEREGRLPSDEQIRDEILKIEAFKKNGNFDKIQYRQLLEANGYTTSSFEKLVRDDLITQGWKEHFNHLARVSDLEVKNDYLENGTKRALKYVLITPEAAQKDVVISEAEIQKFLADSTKLNLAKSRYDSEKNFKYKDKDFTSVKGEIARDLLRAEKTADIRKVAESLADRVVGTMTVSKASDASVNAILKPYNLKVTQSEAMARSNFFVPGFSSSPEVVNEIFSKSPPTAKAKKYSGASGTLVVLVTEQEDAALSKLNAEEIAKRKRQLVTRKQSEIFEQWMQKLNKSAKIKTNARLFGGEA